VSDLATKDVHRPPTRVGAWPSVRVSIHAVLNVVFLLLFLTLVITLVSLHVARQAAEMALRSRTSNCPKRADTSSRQAPLPVVRGHADR